MTTQRPSLVLAGARRPNPSDSSAPAAEENPRRRKRGSRRGAKRARRNPSMLGTFAAVGLGLLAVGGGVMAYRGWRSMRGQKLLPADTALAGVLSKNATLADSPTVVADVRGPVQLSAGGEVGGYTPVASLQVLLENEDGTYTARDVKNVSFGATSGGEIDDAALSGRMPDGSVFNQRNELPGGVVERAIARLVTNVKGSFANDLYQRMLNEIVNKKVNWDDPAARDASIKHVLGIIAPAVDYSRGLETYAFGDAASTAWHAANLMGAVANQSIMNKALQT